MDRLETMTTQASVVRTTRNRVLRRCLPPAESRAKNIRGRRGSTEMPMYCEMTLQRQISLREVGHPQPQVNLHSRRAERDEKTGQHQANCRPALSLR